MPTYEYKCQKCKRTIEIFQRMTESPKRKCPECGGRIRRLIGGGAGFLFKGSGFYITDYRSEGYKKQEAAEKKKVSSGPSKGSTEKKK